MTFINHYYGDLIGDFDRLANSNSVDVPNKFIDLKVAGNNIVFSRTMTAQSDIYIHVIW